LNNDALDARKHALVKPWMFMHCLVGVSHFLLHNCFWFSFSSFLQYEQRHTLAWWADSARITHSFFRAPSAAFDSSSGGVTFMSFS
jgi:hypothetical protein